MTEKNKVYRATFEIVIEKQEELRQLLQTLIDKRRGIKDKEERKKYLLLLSRSTLGVGVDEDIILDSYLDTSGAVLYNFEKTARWLAHQKGRKVELPKWVEPHRIRRKKLKIEEYWEAILYTAYAVFPRAINLAVEASPERFPRTKRKPDRV